MSDWSDQIENALEQAITFCGTTFSWESSGTVPEAGTPYNCIQSASSITNDLALGGYQSEVDFDIHAVKSDFLSANYPAIGHLIMLPATTGTKYRVVRRETSENDPEIIFGVAAVNR